MEGWLTRAEKDKFPAMSGSVEKCRDMMGIFLSAGGAEKDKISWRRFIIPALALSWTKTWEFSTKKSDNYCGQFCPLYPVFFISDLSLSLSHDDVWSSHKIGKFWGNPRGIPLMHQNAIETQYHCGVLKLGYPKSSSRHKIWPNQKKLNAMVSWKSPRLKKLPFFRVPFLCG